MQNDSDEKRVPHIVAVQKQDGIITAYQLSNGQIVDKTTAVAMAKAKQIADVSVVNRRGSEFLRSLPNGSDTNDLDDLPLING